MLAKTALLLLILLGAWGCCLAQPPSFTPPGANVALQKTYTLDPAPNYGDTADAGDATQLTDGEYTDGYFWVQKTTVGWVHVRPVVVTVDLGQSEPIAGASYSTAAGIADVHWPDSVQVMVSDDAREWTILGDLVPLSGKRWTPPPTPYQTHRLVTDELRGHGRYVAFVIEQTPYTVVDEIEIYRGPDAWLSEPSPGRRFTMSPKDYQRTSQVVRLARDRMRRDLNSIIEGINAAMTETDAAGPRAQAEKLGDEIEAWDSVPDDFTTILPLNDLHARIYALQAPVLRARGYNSLAVWDGYRYDMLQPLDAPAQPPSRVPSLSVRMMRNEHRAEVLNLTNPTDAPLAVTVKLPVRVLPAGALGLREVIYTDTQGRLPIAAALAPAQPAERGLKLTIPAGITRQVWLEVDSKSMRPGDTRTALSVTAGKTRVNVPLSLHVADLRMPDEFSIAIGGWDETNNRGGYEVTAENMMPLIKNLREHGVNMPWSNPQVMPTPGEYDAEGNMTAPPDFTAWDEWVGRWQGAKCFGLFPNVSGNFAGEPMGTARFNKMVGAWVTAWVEHAGAQGIAPGQIMLLLVDEPRTPEQDQIIIAWAKALHAAQPGVVVWNDPLHPEPENVDPEFYKHSDVNCPNLVWFLQRTQQYRDFYLAQQQAGHELWFYVCSGPSKLLDPASYFRGQFWANIKYGGKGSCYWAFGDEAGGSWNTYIQPRAQYSPLFISKTTITDGKHMEAIREGAEDYELFMMLRARVAELERKGAGAKLDEAKALLVAGPERAMGVVDWDKIQWTVGKNREVMDRVRLEALAMLEKLSKL